MGRIYAPPEIDGEHRRRTASVDREVSEQPSRTPFSLPMQGADLASLVRLHPDQRREAVLGLSGGNAALQRMLAREPAARPVGGVVESVLDIVRSFTPIELPASVGRGGKNHPEDVHAVQRRLRLLGFLPPEADRVPETEGGENGGVPEAALEETIGAISRYQTMVVRLRRADGRIDVGGQTERALNGWKAQEPEHPSDSAGPARPEAAHAPTVDETTPPPVGATGEHADTAEPARQPEPQTSSATVEQIRAELAPLVQEASRQHTSAKSNRNEEGADERERMISSIAAIRQKIAALTPDQAGVDKAGLAAIKAQLYREVDAASPYYTQMLNKNVLSGEGHEAAMRTCNVTSVSMALGALGKEPEDFKGDRALIARIAGRFAGALGDAGDVMHLRMPDFLQLVAVYLNLKDPPAPEADPNAFEAAVDSAREKAASFILGNYNFDQFTELFGVKSQVHENTYEETLHSFGAVFRQAKGKHKTEAEMRDIDVASYDKEIDKLTAQLEAGKKVNQHHLDQLKRELAEIQATASPEDMETKLPLKVYKASVLAPVTKSLDDGKQVICSMYNHYTRLQSLDEDGLVLDDPGNWEHKDWKVDWEEGRKIGCFLRWTELGG